MSRESREHMPRDGEVAPGGELVAPVGGAALYAAAALSLVAATLHLWATPAHLAEWWGYGVFFLAAACAQGFFAAAVLRWPGQLLYSAGIWGNMAIVLMYVVSRTAGVPAGPHSGEVEAVGTLDMVATVAELGTVLSLVMLLGGAFRRTTVNILLLLGALAWGLRLAGVLP